MAAPVAGLNWVAVDRCRAADDLQPCAASACDGMLHFLPWTEQRGIHVGVLMNRNRFVTAILRRDQAQNASLGRIGQRDLLVAGSQVFFARLNPNLEKVDRFGAGRIEFAVPDT